MQTNTLISLNLMIDGKEKTFALSFISGRMLRRTIEISKSTNFNDVDVPTLDLLVQYIVELFGNQFSFDEFYDGIQSREMFPTIINCIRSVMSKTDAALEPLKDPNE